MLCISKPGVCSSSLHTFLFGNTDILGAQRPEGQVKEPPLGTRTFAMNGANEPGTSGSNADVQDRPTTLESFRHDPSLISSYLDLGQPTAPGLWSGSPNPNDLLSENVFDDLMLDDFDEAQDSAALVDLSLDHTPNAVDLGYVFFGTPNQDSFVQHDISPSHAPLLRVASPSSESHRRNQRRTEGGSATQALATEVNHETFDQVRQSSLAPGSSLRRNPPVRCLSAPDPANAENSISSFQHPQPLEDTPEAIKHLFDQYIYRRLSIKGNEDTNPWQTVVWPLSQANPALYHALAAMTCFHLSREDPRRRDPALQHFKCSTEALAGFTSDESVPLEAALATRLALGFAEAWDSQLNSSGIVHIHAAQPLVQQAISRHQSSQLTPTEQNSLGILANTWMYMDVMARFGRASTLSSTDEELMSACNQLYAGNADHNMDPLLGCASTLFPFLGRLVDIISHALNASNGNNSLDDISRATELRVTFEHWSPTIQIETSDEDKSCVADSIQTAEAYRWAALLLLRQTVPEVPWAHSQLELAQKTLVYLATIPRDSRSTMLQVFPLMVAGVEIMEEDNRNWIRRRWDHMSKVLNMVVAERCQKLLEEVWGRRDDFEERHGIRLSQRTPGAAPDTNEHHSPLNELSRGFSKAGHESRANANLKLSSTTTDFPDSMAFKRGIDPVTRAGHPEYTVRGQLHFLAVMKDWNWERKSIHIPVQTII
jgi:hypothetical protein